MNVGKDTNIWRHCLPLNYIKVQSKSLTMTPQRETEAKVLVETLRPADIIEPGGVREEQNERPEV